MKKRVAPLIGAAVVAGAASWWLLGAGGRGGELVLYGNIDIREVQLGFRVAGRIERMLFDEGDSVKRGALLASLDRQPFLNDLAAREAAVSQAASNLQKLESGNRPLEIEQSRALVNERKATLESARKTFQRSEKLAESDYVSKQTYDLALTARNEAEARLKSAELALSLSIEGPRKEDIAAGRAALDAAKAQRDIAQTALNDAALTAPANGVILTRAVEPGAIVGAGATVYSLSLREPVWARAYVAEGELGRIHPGMTVTLTSDTHPDKPYEGQVGYISPVAEFTPKTVETPELRSDLVYRLRIVVRNADDSLRQGMPVTIHAPAAAGAPPAASPAEGPVANAGTKP